MVQKSFVVLLLALWVVAIAIISVQNATPVGIKFLGLESVSLPVGVVLGFGAAGGMVVSAGVLLWLTTRRTPQRSRKVSQSR